MPNDGVESQPLRSTGDSVCPPNIDGLSLDQDISVSVSTIFHPTANLRGREQPNLIVLTSDSVFFYVHCGVLLEHSDNQFGGHIPSFSPQTNGQPLVAQLDLSSTVFNLVVHALYGKPCLQFSTSFNEISAAICSLPTFGIPVDEYVYPDSPLFEAAMAHASTVPLDVYAFAANLDLHQLANAASPHLLSIPISAITDDHATRIGPLYLKRLVTLHMKRTDKLKQLLLSPPIPHATTPDCNAGGLNRAWSFATAFLAWEVRPNLSSAMIKSALGKGEAHLSCSLCKQCLESRIDTVLEEWLQENRNIYVWKRE